MSTKYNTQKKLKKLKKDIVETSAINVGYRCSIVSALPDYSILEAVKEISTTGLVKAEMEEADVCNILITEAVKKMNFQDFKEIAKYFIYKKSLKFKKMSVSKFNTGQIVSTKGVSEMCEAHEKMNRFIADSMKRHIQGDWGDLDQEDKDANDEALSCPLDKIKDWGDRILSAYNFEQLPGIRDTKIYILTEGDRSVTTIYFPSEH